jgi:tight adherence protein B
VLAELRLGRPLEESLEELGERVPSEDLRFVLVAILLQRQAGGSLSGLLDTVTETVRQRHQFARKVRALTATVRMSARVLVGLPVLVAVVLVFVNRDYMRPLYATPTGHLLIAVAVCGMACGTLILRRIAAPRG